MWRLVEGSRNLQVAEDISQGKACGYHSQLRQKTHLTIKKVTEDMEGTFHFNTAISSIMELVNEIYDFTNDERRTASDELKEAIQTVVILLAPFVPHIAEEMWEKLGNKESVFKAAWPAYDKDAMIRDTIELPVQINGKLRSKIEISSGAGEDEIKKIVSRNPVINKWIEGKLPKKIIIVKGKLVNLVI